MRAGFFFHIKKNKNHHSSRNFRGSFFKRRLFYFFFSLLRNTNFKEILGFYGMKCFSGIALDCKFSEGFLHVFSYINGRVAEPYSSEGPG